MTTRHDGDAIAIVGLSCRFAPDLNSPDALWSFLTESGSAISEMPDKRWDPYTSAGPETTAILRRTTRKGTFLDDIEGFDAEFFQITPREAEYLDPQQRIMLELAWEALGDAGLPPHSLADTQTGVFVAANTNDYGRRLLEDLSRTGAWAVNGTTYYGIANRISYFLDLRGPSMAVDTACAGSLTALHVAGQSLLLGESSVAIVGGIHIMSSPALMVALDAAGATAPDGCSKAFDKSADGYGRGEGAGVMVLKRLSDARRDGDRVRALLTGTGVFQDGRSEGMMAPNSEAQEQMLREVYRRAGVDPASVGYVEAHGTGTPLGDLAEIRAIAGVLGENREPARPLLIGTLKPNIGHVEAASGIAGVLKTVLSIEHGAIPPSVHDEVNPQLELDRAGLRLVAETTPWPAGEQPRRAGVSSYGVGGTIAHVIVEEAPPGPAPAADDTQAERVFPLSAASEAGVRALAGTVADWLRAHPDTPLDSVAHTLTRRRSHLSARAAVVASSVAELTGLMDGVAAGDRSPRSAIGRVNPAHAEGPVWVFSGHGAQWSGMGRELLRDDPVFASTVDALAEVFRAELGWSPREVIESGEAERVSTVQAMTFAMQVALAATWRARGVRPSAVIGHSVGEIAAAVAAGSLDLLEAARFACRRAAALERVAGRGAMALIELSFSDAEKRVLDRDGVVAAIAASLRSTVVSGDDDAVTRLVADLRSEHIEARPVNTDVAFHSPHVDEVLPVVGAAGRELTARPPRVPLYTTALENPRATDPREGGYWETNLRSPVRFVEAVQAALADGARAFLEISAHPVVAHSINETFHEVDVADATVAVSLRRDQPEVPTLLSNLALLHCSGAEVDWPYRGDLVSMPVVHWQHRPYWIFPETSEDSGGRGHDPDTHTLLGGLGTVAGTPAQQVWQTYLDMSNRPYAQDHKVVGVETVPASVVINSFAVAASKDDAPVGLNDIVFRTPLAATPPRVVQVVLGQNRIRLASRIRRDDAGGSTGHDQEWITHSTATVRRNPVVSSRRMEAVEDIRSRCDEEWTWNRVDVIFRDMGVDGYTFPWVVEELRRNAHEQFALVTIDHEPKLHPSSWTAVLDGALTVSGVLVTDEDSQTLRTSSHLDSIAYTGPPPGRIVVHTTRSRISPDTSVDVLVADMHGNVVCEAKGLRFTKVQDRPGPVLPPRELVHEVSWEPVGIDAANRDSVERVVLLGDADTTAQLVGNLEGRGRSASSVKRLDDLGTALGDQPGIVVVTPEARREGETPEAAAERCAWTLLDAAQHLQELGSPHKLWCLTRGARDPQRESAVAHGTLWGVSRIVAGECMDIWGGVVDIADDVDLRAGDTADRLLGLFAGLAPAEDVVSVTPEDTFVARLSRIERLAGGEAPDCRPDGTYLITGGLGGIGLEVARHLADHGARRLVLAGRRGLPPRADWDAVDDPAVLSRIDAVLALEAQGVTVRVLALDISDHDAVAAALHPSAWDLPPVRGVVHAAGVVSNALVTNTSRDDLRNTLGPKAHGAMVLHRLFPPGTLDFFAMFSSCGQLARLTGQAGYAAANSFMDSLAAYRHAGGHTETVSLAWTQWRGTGMGETTAATTILEAEARGLGGISATEAFGSWSFSRRFDLPYYAILRVLPERSLPVLGNLEVVDGTEEAASTTVDWAEVPDAELRDRVRAEVHEQVAAELNLTGAGIEPDKPLIELGIDSVLTVGLRVRLHRRFGVDMPSTILWSNPTIRALAGFLTDALREDTAGE